MNYSSNSTKLRISLPVSARHSVADRIPENALTAHNRVVNDTLYPGAAIVAPR